MKYLFDFGISQEDACTEMKALDVKDGDKLLCIASAGEVPLNILANKKISIEAVDLSQNQIYLSRLKLFSSRLLDPDEVTGFLGFTRLSENCRLQLFDRLVPFLTGNELDFWKMHKQEIEQGIISSGRFEKYISKFDSLALLLIGKKKLLKLMEFDSVAEQKIYFKRNFNLKLLKKLFDIIFYPKFYKDRGVSKQGFRNNYNSNKSEFFFSRFKSFCTSTLARQNYYLQYFLFKQVLFPEALPDYLSEAGIENIRSNYDRIKFLNVSYLNALENNETRFNKFHLSNISDWMDQNEFVKILYKIKLNSRSPFKIISRYIHSNHLIPDSLQNDIIIDYELSEKLIAVDKFPFYNLVAMSG